MEEKKNSCKIVNLSSKINALSKIFKKLSILLVTATAVYLRFNKKSLTETTTTTTTTAAAATTTTTTTTTAATSCSFGIRRTNDL